VIRTILVPLDGSELSLSILPTIEEIAGKLDASLVLFHAINPIPGFDQPDTLAADADFVKEYQLRAEASLEKAAGPLREKGRKVSTMVLVGPAVDETLVAAEKSGADMIAMSTHGHSGIGRWIMGSVADAVLRRTHLPCLVVRPEKVAKAGDR
jgi:nucleotide-binding universal stress UspA family protein